MMSQNRSEPSQAAATHTVSSPVPSRPRVYPLALLPLVGLIVIEIIWGAPQAGYRSEGSAMPTGDPMGYIVRPVALTFGAVIVAGIVFVLSNRRSWAANVAFAGRCCSPVDCRGARRTSRA
jgi:hypothetical protein